MCATWVLAVCSERTRLRRDLSVRETAGDEAQHLELLGVSSPSAGGGAGGAAPANRSISRRVTAGAKRCTAGHDPDPGHQLFLRGVLEQEAAGASSESFVHVFIEVEGRQHEHSRRALTAIHDPAGRLDAVHVRHADVHEHDIRIEFARQGDRLAAVRGLANDIDVGFGAEDDANAAAHERLVIREQDADRHARADRSGRRTRGRNRRLARRPACNSPP